MFRRAYRGPHKTVAGSVKSRTRFTVETGMDLMKTHKFVHRAVFTAALSTASIFTSASSIAMASESGFRTSSSGIQLVQYQPPQSAPVNAQPNPAVTAELKRMFEESGQPMPSMNANELPNAQGQQANNIRPTQRPGKAPANMPQGSMQQARIQTSGMRQGSGQNAGRQQAAASAPSKPAAEKNVFKRFMSKVSGQEKKAAEAAVVPPVPPDYRAPAPAPPAGAVASTPVQNGRQAMPNPQNGQQSTLSSPAPRSQGVPTRTASASQSGSPGGNLQNKSAAATAPVRTAQAPAGSVQVRPASQPSQPVPAVPRIAQTPKKSAAPQAVSQNPQYQQPGSAPGFMPAGQSKSVVVQPAAKLPATAVNVAQQTPPKSGSTGNETRSDGLDDLFLESDASEDATDALDLDALVVSPKAMLAPAIESKPVVATESQPDENATEQNPFEAGESAVLEVVREANPLTGVRLEDSDEELFDAALSKSAATAGKSLLDGGTAAAKEAVAEIDEFGNSLPAIDLPAVEDLTQSVSEVLAQPDLGLPELDAADSAEASTGRAVLNSTEEQKSIPPVELKTVDAASGRNADTERLQQVAEQDRRLKQQRMIQSRAGQTGFKGYCPVELRDRRELVETNAEFTATFGLQTYSFSSAAAKTAFEGDPSRYAPAAGGSDVVLLVNGGEEQPGMLDYALWYRDRLYLFRSRETMAMFNSDPLRFANQY